MQIAADHEKHGLQVIGVTDASIDDTLRLLDERSLPFAILAGAGPVREQWQVGVIWGSPTYLVDVAGGGRIVAEEVLALGDEEFAGLLDR